MMRMIRQLVCAASIMLPVCALSSSSLASQPLGEKGVSPAKQARREALSKQRRVIFNSDSGDLIPPQGGTVDGFLSTRLKSLVGTHVDVIAWSVLGTWGDAPVYDCKVQPVFGDAHNEAQPTFPNYVPNLKKLLKAGHCPLQIVIDFSHENGMECWAGVRMNDCHDSFVPGIQTTWKKNHPELLVDSTGIPAKKKHPMGLYRTAQDFTHQEVRDRKFEIIKDIAERYDVDGFQFNFIRHPAFFSRTLRGLPVTAEEVEIMTSLMRRIRRFTDKVASRRGRPILLAAIVPDNLQLGMNVGLDVRAWVKEDLVDVLIPGLGYAPFSVNVAEFAELAHPYGVSVYPCVNRVAPWMSGKELVKEFITEGARAVATNWYSDGADGVFFWNLGCPFTQMTGQEQIDERRIYFASLSEVGEARTLAGKDKLFCVDNPVHDPHQLGIGPYHHIASTPPLPVDLTPGKPQQVPLTVGDHLAVAGKLGTIKQLQLKLELTGPVDKTSLVVQLNDHELAEGELVKSDDKKPKYELRYAPAPSLFRTGENIITASLDKTPETDSPVVFRGLKLLVRYKPR